MIRSVILLLLVTLGFNLWAQTQQKQATVSGGGSTTGPATNSTRKLFSVVGQAVAVQAVNSPASFKNGQSGFMQVTNYIISTSTPASEPTAQPTNFTVSNRTPNSYDLNFTAASGSPTGYLIVERAAGIPTGIPVDGTSYIEGNTLGDGVVVQASSATIFSKTGLGASNSRSYAIFAYNGTGSSINYLTTGALTGQAITLEIEPTAQPTNLQFTNVTTTSYTVSFTVAVGSPVGYLVLRKAGSAPTEFPEDGIVYSVGESIGTSTIASIRVGTNTSFDETGLTQGVTYHYAVFSYERSTDPTINYLTTNPLRSSQSLVVTEPTAQATSLLFTNVQSTTLTVSFTAATGSPAGYIVLRKVGSSPSDVPVDGTSYTQGSILGASTVAYVGSAVTFSETSLTADTQYFYDVFSYNGSGVTSNYLTTSPLENNATTSPISATEPTTQASSLTITQPFASTLQLTWTNGNGTSRLVIGKAGTTIDQAPIDGVTYAASTSFTVGQDLSGGNYVVYKGTGNSVAVTDIQPGTVYHFFVFEFNGTAGLENYKTSTASGNPANFTSEGSSDTTPPNVVHTAAASTPIGVALTINADITDTESTVSSAILQWKSVTATTPAFTDATMTKGSGNTWSGQIPATAITNLGVEYKIKATNAASIDNTASQTIYRTSISHPAASLSITPIANLFGREQSKYRMIAIPLNLTNKTVDGIFASKLGTYDATKWTMYRLNNSTQKTDELSGSSVLIPGEGYWFLSTIKPEVSIGDGQTVPIDKPFEITLGPKWNQIGNPFPFSIDWSDVLAAMGTDAVNLSSKPRKYNGSKDDSQGSIGAFEGAYIENKTNPARTITLIIPLKKTLGGRVSTNKHNPINSDDWEVLFTLENDNQKFIHGGLGMHRDASNGFDYHDDSAMPPFADYLDIRFDNTVADRVLTKNIVSVTDNYEWEFDVNTNMPDLPSTLSWANDYFGVNDKEIWLLNKESGEVHDMRKVNSINLRTGFTVLKFKVVIGDLEFIKESTLPDHLVLSVSPNPVADLLAISIAVPKKSRVSVDVFDMSGKRLQNFMNDFTERGRYKFEWDITQQPLSAGIYLVRLQSDDGIQYQRVVKY